MEWKRNRKVKNCCNKCCQETCPTASSAILPSPYSLACLVKYCEILAQMDLFSRCNWIPGKGGGLALQRKILLQAIWHKNGVAIYLGVWCRMEKTAKKWFLERSRTLKNSAFDPLNANHLLNVNINVRDWLDM